MPVYVYKNLKTGVTFEVEQRITEEALATDPATGDPVKRIIQPVGIAFKGSGFYVNDSRGSKNAAVASKPAKDADGASSASGTDASDTGKSTSTAAEASKPAPAATGSTSSTSTPKSTPSNSAS